MTIQHVEAILETSRWRFGPPPTEYVYGDDLDWSSALVETELFVELPFWMMVSAGSVDVAWEGLNRPGFDGGSTSWRKMESCQTTPAATSPRIAIQPN
jgi:hypothetical protein